MSTCVIPLFMSLFPDRAAARSDSHKGCLQFELQRAVAHSMMLHAASMNLHATVPAPRGLASRQTAVRHFSMSQRSAKAWLGTYSFLSFAEP